MARRPTIPFWLGEAPGRSDELSIAVSRLREHDRGPPASPIRPGTGAARLADRRARPRRGGGRAAGRLSRAPAMPRWAACRRADTIVLERFFDEAGGMQLVVHSPYGSRLNRAWGLALRKRFCRKFNFELAGRGDRGQHRPLAHRRAQLRARRRGALPAFGQRRATCSIQARARCADVHHALALGERRVARRCRASAAAARCRRSSRAWRAEDLIGSVVPRPDRLRREPARRTRDPRSSAGAPDASATACDEAMDTDGLERLLEAIEVGRRPRGRPRPHRSRRRWRSKC